MLESEVKMDTYHYPAPEKNARDGKVYCCQKAIKTWKRPSATNIKPFSWSRRQVKFRNLEEEPITYPPQVDYVHNVFVQPYLYLPLVHIRMSSETTFRTLVYLDSIRHRDMLRIQTVFHVSYSVSETVLLALLIGESCSSFTSNVADKLSIFVMLVTDFTDRFMRSIDVTEKCLTPLLAGTNIDCTGTRSVAEESKLNISQYDTELSAMIETPIEGYRKAIPVAGQVVLKGMCEKHGYSSQKPLVW